MVSRLQTFPQRKKAAAPIRNADSVSLGTNRFTMRSPIVFVFLLISFFGHAQHQHVNPLIGTGGHGHTFPGATVPFGMVQLSPDTRIDGSWDGCSGYHYSDHVIYGFSHTHLSGTGCSDYGDVMLMPTMGTPSLDKEQYASRFSHNAEKATAGYYSVHLDDDDIDVALTASTRVGFHQYTFRKKGQANFILDLNHRDKLLMGEVRIINDKTIEVMRRSQAWARDQYIFARIEFSKPVKVTDLNNNAFARPRNTDSFFAGSVLAISFSANVRAGEKINVKVALSPTSYEGAERNMTEIKGWDFGNVKSAAEAAWDTELGKIELNESDSDKRTIFYTALYHTMTQPNVAHDIDGQYRGRDNHVHPNPGFGYYSVFSLWDTFRAAHPLYTLIDRKRTADFINTFLRQYEEGGRLPVWELASNETDCMIGYHSVSVMADAMAKGIKGFDYEKAFQAAKHSAMLDHLGLAAYKKNGFIAIDDEHESVSKTLEYAYDDWCIAQMAKLTGHKDDYDYFMMRSQNWKNLFDPSTGFMRPKRNGGWDKPFDPREVNNNFTEGNAWQYSLFVPHDIAGLATALGGQEALAHKLDDLFNAPTQTTGREQADITGLIGQYAHGNEPSHHMAWLYVPAGQPQKAQEKIQFILNNFYKNTPDGLIGNEDCGQMSAWYVLSTLGMYAICPGQPAWTYLAPSAYATVHLEDGSKKPISDVTPPFEYWFPDYRRELATETSGVLLPVPAIEAPSRVFTEKMPVSIKAVDRDVRCYYRVQEIGHRDEKKDFMVYQGPFFIEQSGKVETYAEQAPGIASAVVTGTFIRKPNAYTVEIRSTYNPQYHAGGPEGLLDGIRGSENWRKGDWQGYQAQDFEAVVDLKEMRSAKEISAGFLQDSRSWILMPREVEFLVSTDGQKFFPVGKKIITDEDPQREDTFIKEYGLKDPIGKFRYVKVIARNFGKLPAWHQGAGGDAFIFIDEITIR